MVDLRLGRTQILFSLSLHVNPPLGVRDVPL